MNITISREKFLPLRLPTMRLPSLRKRPGCNPSRYPKRSMNLQHTVKKFFGLMK